MNFRRAFFLLLCCASVLVLSVAMASADTVPGVALYQKFTVPGEDGAAKTAMFVPGKAAGEVVLLLADFECYALTPLGTPVPPPPPPDVLTGFAKTAFDAVGDLPKPEAASLAGAFEVVASQIAAGVLKTPAEIIAATKTARTAALTTERATAWDPWVKVIGAALNTESAAGRLATPDQHKVVWLSIAQGLRRAAQ